MPQPMMQRRKHRLFEDPHCNGYGTMVCHCGGDLCICGLDGEDCFGCEKCSESDDSLPVEGGERDSLPAKRD